jgi:ATP-binding cassette subfamily B protein
MKIIKLLFQKMRQYDPKMLWMLAANAVSSALYPFIWVFVPAIILRYYQCWELWQLIVLLLGAGILAMLFGFIVEWLQGNYRMRMNTVRYKLIHDLTEATLRMPYENTLKPDMLDRIDFARNTVSSPYQGAGGIMLRFLPLFGEILAVFGFIGVLSSLSPWMLLVIAVLLITHFWGYKTIATVQEDTWVAFAPYWRRVYDMTNISHDPLRKKDILLYNTWDMLKTYILGFMQKFLEMYQLQLKTETKVGSLLAFMDLLRDVVIFGWVIVQFLNGRMDAATFVLYTGGLLSFILVMQNLARNLAEIQLESTRFSNYVKLMEEIDAQIEADKASTFPVQDSGPDIEIRIEDLSFTYPNAENPVISSLNLTIPAGEKCALVGENGAGKSTLIKLLCRLYRPSFGRILMNDVDIWQYPEQDYFNKLSVVFQDAIIFPFSIKENVTMANDSQTEPYARAKEQSGLQEIIEVLPQADETSLLRILDDSGVELSGGEKQKLFLARALYKENAHFLILDEPTAALDALAEKELYERFATFTENKTSIFVSHRLASTRFCDRIVFLKNGSISEMGSHDELIALKGEYAELFELQAKNYRAEKAQTEIENDLIGGQDA